MYLSYAKASRRRQSQISFCSCKYIFTIRSNSKLQCDPVFLVEYRAVQQNRKQLFPKKNQGTGFFPQNANHKQISRNVPPCPQTRTVAVPPVSSGARFCCGCKILQANDYTWCSFAQATFSTTHPIISPRHPMSGTTPNQRNPSDPSTPDRHLHSATPPHFPTTHLALLAPGATPPGAGAPHSSSAAALSPVLPAFALFPHNPSIGLRLLTPVVPASDNKPALAALSTFQLLCGLGLMARRPVRLGEAAWRARLGAVARVLLGAALVLLSGLEYARLLLPYDPWGEEARRWRHWAVKNGHRPSWWYGAIEHYTPMPMDQWRAKTVAWIGNTANAMETAPLPAESVLSSVSIGPNSTLKAAQAGTYLDIYSHLRLINTKRTRSLLEGDLADVTELTRARRIDAALEGMGRSNPDYSKPNIVLGSHPLDSDDEFDMVWANFEPWDEIGEETEFDVRIIPRWLNH